MKKSIFAVFLLTILYYSCQTEELTTQSENETEELSTEDQQKISQYVGGFKYFLVANRGSGTVSVFDAKSTEFVRDIRLPDATAQPTYLAHSRRNNSIYVGDFANQKIVYYNARTFQKKGEISIGEGAFHLWANDFVGQLWVNNIVSKTTSVINLRTNKVINTLSLPTIEIPELTENAVQHDVTISLNGRFAYVTILDGPDLSYVVQYDTRTQRYLKHETVGGDAHLLATIRDLYVPSQVDGEITVFDSRKLVKKDEVNFPSSHGVASSLKYIFTTGIEDQKVGVINRFTNEVVSTVDSPFVIPHNVATNFRSNIVFLAHSGAEQTMVSFFDVAKNGEITLRSSYASGLNPFGVLSY